MALPIQTGLLFSIPLSLGIMPPKIIFAVNFPAMQITNLHFLHNFSLAWICESMKRAMPRSSSDSWFQIEKFPPTPFRIAQVSLMSHDFTQPPCMGHRCIRFSKSRFSKSRKQTNKSKSIANYATCKIIVDSDVRLKQFLSSSWLMLVEILLPFHLF